MRTSRVGRRTGPTSNVGGSSATESATVIAVRVDARIGCIGDPRPVRAVNTLRVVVTRHVCASSADTSAGSTVMVMVAGVRVVSRVRVVSGVTNAASTVISVAVNAGIGRIGYPRPVRAVDTLWVIIAGGCRVCPRGRVGPVVTVTVDSWVGSIGNARVVGAVSTFGYLVLLVAVESLLDLVDESRHVG